MFSSEFTLEGKSCRTRACGLGSGFGGSGFENCQYDPEA